MPVLLIAEADLPEEAYAEMADKMMPLIRQATGFICHVLQLLFFVLWSRCGSAWLVVKAWRLHAVTSFLPRCQAARAARRVL